MRLLNVGIWGIFIFLLGLVAGYRAAKDRYTDGKCEYQITRIHRGNQK